MSTYLDAVDDGLRMRPSGPWARRKLDYVARYIDIFTTSMHQKSAPRTFIDLEAGPGKNRVRGSGQVLLGSPLLALNSRYPFTNHYFVDQDPANTEALGTRCSVSPRAASVTIATADCNKVVESIVQRIRASSPWSLNLAFLDPEGLELQWATVAQLVSLPVMDLIINYPEGAIKRNMIQAAASAEDTSIDAFFGDRRWRTVVTNCVGKPRCQRQLMDLYKQNLRDRGYKSVVGDNEIQAEPLMRNTKQAPLYRLLFASKHTLGQEFWRKIVQRDADGQLALPLV